MPTRHELGTVKVESRHTRWARCRACTWEYRRTASSADIARHAIAHVDETGHHVTVHDAVTATFKPKGRRT